MPFPFGEVEGRARRQHSPLMMGSRSEPMTAPLRHPVAARNAEHVPNLRPDPLAAVQAALLGARLPVLECE